MFANLSHDLLHEILIKLPLKSLLKFRCVSKSWHSLISNPSFISHQINHSNKINDHILFLHDEFFKELTCKLCKNNNSLDMIKNIETPFVKDQNNTFLIMGFINGLIFMLEKSIDQPQTLILWNPLIRKYLFLPSPYFDDDPIKSFSIYGFGFSSSSNDYKVVRIMHYQIDSIYPPRFIGPFVEIFRLSKGLWQKLEETPIVVPWISKQVYLNDSIHWLTLYKENIILVFDLNSETFNKMDVPKDLKGSCLSTLVLESWVGLLGVFVVPNYVGDIKLWVMKDYGVYTSWSMNLVIRCFEIVRPISCVRKDGKILFHDMKGERLILYDPKMDEFEELKIEAPQKFQVASCVESLVLFDCKKAKGY